MKSRLGLFRMPVDDLPPSKKQKITEATPATKLCGPTAGTSKKSMVATDADLKVPSEATTHAHLKLLPGTTTQVLDKGNIIRVPGTNHVIGELEAIQLFEREVARYYQALEAAKDREQVKTALKNIKMYGFQVKNGTYMPYRYKKPLMYDDTMFTMGDDAFAPRTEEAKQQAKGKGLQ